MRSRPTICQGEYCRLPARAAQISPRGGGWGQPGCNTWITRLSIMSRVLAAYAAICGDAACALRASGLSHFSMTTNVSGPNLVWKFPMPSASTAGPYSIQPFSACTAGILAWNSFRIVSRMPDLAVMMATTWIILVSSLGNAFENAVVAAGQQWADLCRPATKVARLLPCRAFQDIGRVELVNRQILLHPWHSRMFELIARARADTGHFGQHREMLGIIDPVEFGLVFRRDVQLHDKDVGHVRRSAQRHCAGDLSYAA